MAGRSRTLRIVGISVGAIVVLGLGLLLLLKLLGALVGELSPRGPVRIPVKADAYTSGKFREDLLDFTRRTMVAPYRQVGVRNPAWDAAAEKYLEANARAFSSLTADPAARERLATQGQSVVALGCSDPMVAYCYGAALQDTGRLGEAQTWLERAVAGFEQTAYPRARAWMAALRLSRVYEDTGKEEEAAQRLNLAIEWAAKGAAEVRDKGRDPQCYLFLLSSRWDDLTGSSLEALYEAVKSTPKTPAYIADVVGGWTETDVAWSIRGAGWAKDVPEDKWDGFFAHLSTAEELLTRAWKQHPEFPQAPAAMIRVAMGQSRGNPAAAERRWFTRAASAQLDYEPAYHAYLWARRPRWGGSHQEMRAFGKACLDTGRFDTVVPEWYLQAISDVSEERATRSGLWASKGAYDDIARMCRGYLEAAKTQEERDYYATVLGQFAWFTNHYADARQAFETAGPRAQPAVFARWQLGASLGEARAASYALGGPAAKLVRQVEAAARAGDAARVQTLSAAVRQKDPSPFTAEYLSYRLADMDWSARYARGEWVELVSQPGFIAWKQDRGRWEREADGALRGVAGPEGLEFTKWQGFGPRMELEGEIEYVAVPCPEAGRVRVGVGFGRTSEGFDGVRLYLSPTAGEAALVRHDDESVKARAALSPTRRVQFRVQLWDGAVTAFINGQPAFSGVRVMPEAAAEGGLALSCDYRGPGAVYRFRNLRVRKLIGS